MSTLEAETDIEDTVQQESQAVEIIDCGCASELTRGTTFLILHELGSPPMDKLFFN